MPPKISCECGVCKVCRKRMWFRRWRQMDPQERRYYVLSTRRPSNKSSSTISIEESIAQLDAQFPHLRGAFVKGQP